MTIELELSVNVATGSAAPWKLLTDPSTWKTWWPDCIEAATADHRALREGSELEVVVQPKHQKFTYRPVVDLYSEGKTLSLTHRSAIVQCTVAWYLQEMDAGTRITARAVFAGLAAYLMRPLGQVDTARFSLHSCLRGLKKLSERMTA